MKKIIELNNFGEPAWIDSAVLKSIRLNGTFVPGIERVVYNLKTTDQVPETGKDGQAKTVQAVNKDGTRLVRKDGTPVMIQAKKTVAIDPVLTTIVFFNDGTRVTVRNSPHDKVSLETEKLADGTEIRIADRCSKEAGLVYAIVKRVMGGYVNTDNSVSAPGFGRVLNGIIDAAEDQVLIQAKAKAQRNLAKAKNAEKKPQAKKPEKKAKAKKAVNRLRFKDMNQEQKRAYWRAANRRRAGK